MVKHMLAIIGLVFAGLAAWPAWTDGAAMTTATADSRGQMAEHYRLAAPPACREAANPRLARSLLGVLGGARAPRGRQPGARPCACLAAPAGNLQRTGPGHLPGWNR